MAVTSFYMGSLRYSPCGRKRKNHAANRVKKKPIAFKSTQTSQTQLKKIRARQAVQYKSLMEEYMKNGTYHEIKAIVLKKNHQSILAP